MASLLRENYIVATGDTPKVSNVKTDPRRNPVLLRRVYEDQIRPLTRGQCDGQGRVSRGFGDHAHQQPQSQTAGDHEVEWNGLDPADTTGKKLLVSQEGTCTVSVPAVNPVTGSSSTAKGTLVIRQ